MAKTTGPLLSFDASGSLGQTLVFSRWKGIAYSRRYVIPANPNTSGQQQTRSVFSWLQGAWSFMPAEVRESWDAYAQGQPMTGRNALAKFNVSPMRGETDLAEFLFAPSAKSGPPAAGITVTPGTEQLTVELDPSELPTGWTIVQMVAAAIIDQDPQTEQDFNIVAGTDATDPYEVILTGLTASELYRVGAWFKYTRPDGSFAYGRATMSTGTPTA